MLEYLTAWLIGFGVVTSMIGFWASGLTIYDWYVLGRISRAEHETVPIQIRRSIPYSALVAGIVKAQKILDEVRFVPNIIIGVHYMGLSFGALLAKQLYIPIRRAEIRYATGRQDTDQVVLDFDLKELQGKNVLLVDNSIRTGKTLKMVYDQVAPSALHVKTLVVYKSTAGAVSAITPDFILFQSRSPLKFLR